MLRRSVSHCFFTGILTISWFLLPGFQVFAQSTATLQGRVVDPKGAAVAGAMITVQNQTTGVTRVAQTDTDGSYQTAALPAGTYRIEVRARSFQTLIVDSLAVEVARSIVQDFQLQIGSLSDQVTVTATVPLLERSTVSVGHVIDRRMVQDIPLNGRHFLDLALLVPGSATPPQDAFSAAPMRAEGSLAFNTAGNREETVNYKINGITLNNLTFSSISFQPSISSIQEFKVDNSTFSAEHGQSSGAVVNIATRSGSSGFHGELFEFFRNDALDARNFFEFNSSKPAPFKRNQFGGGLGGPMIKKKMFFFFSYEGLRQLQELNLNSLVLSGDQRASTTDSVVRKLIELIPRANYVDSSGTPRFIGSAAAPVDVDQWTADISHSLREIDRVHGYYAICRTQKTEPNRFGNTIPGFGHANDVLRQIFTLNETHTSGPALVNEALFGFNRFSSTSIPNAKLNPADFGIRDGIDSPIGLPQISIAGSSLNFGGPANQPSGRNDTTFVLADTISWLSGRHSLKAGGEYRQFFNNSFRQVTGSFNFPTVASFLTGTANSFNITLGNQSSDVTQGALGSFVQDNYKVHPNLTLELGLRYEWNMTPAEDKGRFIVFDPQTSSLLRVGTHVDEVYNENNRNFQPRIGFAWDPWSNGKTSVRAGYAILVDQPMTSVVTGTSANPPLAIPLTFAGPIRFDNAIDLARDAGLALQTVDHGFSNAYLQSWNLNFQREFTPGLTAMAAYVGSKGTHLILRRNINQPVNGMRPYPTLSGSSPILPGTALGNITQVESTGNSSYNALWLSATRRLVSSLQFNASYTWSKSLDYNSYSSQGIVVQNSYNLRGDRGFSDYDARHHFVISALYELPFRNNRLTAGWQFSLIVQCQSGNPVNVVTSNSTVTGVPNTLRPDVTGPVEIVGRVEQWFETSVFMTLERLGNFGRNVIIGPGFSNTDFAVIKKLKLGDRVRAQFRAEFFDFLNHANLGQPGNVVGSPGFSRIIRTRFPTGESGSSRQVQLALKLEF